MSRLDKNRFAQALERGKLTPQDEADVEEFLLAHPEERAWFEEELAMNRLLAQLPNTPVSSNFTARVLQAAQAEARSVNAPIRGSLADMVRGWIPKLVTVTAAVAVFLSAYHHRQTTLRREFAQHLAEVTAVANSTPPLELLQNFDAIARLSQVPPTVDRELIAALQ